MLFKFQNCTQVNGDNSLYTGKPISVRIGLFLRAYHTYIRIANDFSSV